MNDNKIIIKALTILKDLTGIVGTWKPLDSEIDGEIGFLFLKRKIKGVYCRQKGAKKLPNASDY